MEKLKQLWFLALLLVLSTSCSSIVSTNYEVMEYGTVAAIDDISVR